MARDRVVCELISFILTEKQTPLLCAANPFLGFSNFFIRFFIINILIYLSLALSDRRALLAAAQHKEPTVHLWGLSGADFRV
jgi:hypothetical protein